MRIFYLNDRSADLAFFAGRFTKSVRIFYLNDRSADLAFFVGRCKKTGRHIYTASSRAAGRRVAIQKNPSEEPALFYRERLDWIASLRSQ